MKQIIVPTDFSPTALKALNFAAGLAIRCGASLHILHAFTLLENVFVENSSMRDAWNEQQKEEKRGHLLRLKQLLGEKYPELSVTPHLFSGPTENAIMEYAIQQNADLIVMGTQGASGLAKVLVGSTTADLIAKSKIPVLAIPEKYEIATPEYLLLATKNFEMDDRTTGPVFFFSSLWDMDVRVMVYEPDDDEENEKLEHENQLGLYVTGLQKQYPLTRLSAFIIEGDDFELAIDDYMRENGSGILCMITYQRGFWESFFNPSLTREMAYHTEVPLLAIPGSRLES